MKIVAALLLFSAAAIAAPKVEILQPQDYAQKVVAAHKGKTLVVNFWATWCDPCREEMPELSAATAKQPVDVVLVSLDSTKTLDPVRAFLKSQHIDGKTFIAASGDPEIFINTVDKTWDGTLPYTVVYASDGKIAARLKGAQRAKDFARAISEAKTNMSH